MPSGMDLNLAHLDFMLATEAMLPDDLRVCSLILAELKTLYDAMLRTTSPCSMNALLCFPKQESAAFAQLIKRRVPQALVLLAYYCVLLDLLDARWWIRGWSSRVLRDVVGELEGQWRRWTDWPVEGMLLKGGRREAALAGNISGDFLGV